MLALQLGAAAHRTTGQRGARGRAATKATLQVDASQDTTGGNGGARGRPRHPRRVHAPGDRRADCCRGADAVGDCSCVIFVAVVVQKNLTHISQPSDIPTEKGRLDPVERDEHPVPRRDLLHNVDGPPQQEGRRARPRADARVADLDLGQGFSTSDVREEP